MPGNINNAGFLTPPMLLSADDLDRQRLLDDWYGRLAHISTLIAGSRASLKDQKEKVEREIRSARKTADPATLYADAEKLSELEIETRRKFQPAIDQLTDILVNTTSADPDDRVNRAIRRYAEEFLDISVSWLELIQNYRIECLRIASKKGAVRPVVSSSDELEREFASLIEDED